MKWRRSQSPFRPPIRLACARSIGPIRFCSISHSLSTFLTSGTRGVVIPSIIQPESRPGAFFHIPNRDTRPPEHYWVHGRSRPNKRDRELHWLGFVLLYPSHDMGSRSAIPAATIDAQQSEARPDFWPCVPSGEAPSTTGTTWPEISSRADSKFLKLCERC